MPGKVDWLARGLPVEGDAPGPPRALPLARNDVVTCRLDEAVGEIRPRVAASPYGFAFVTTAEGVLLGRLRRAALEGDPAATAADAMEPGPSTSRADTDAAALLDKLRRADLTTAVLTDPEGRLKGIVRRADLESAGDGEVAR